MRTVVLANAPKVEFGEVTVGDDGEGAVATHVSVVVKDGDEAVKCAAEKVATTPSSSACSLAIDWALALSSDFWLLKEERIPLVAEAGVGELGRAIVHEAFVVALQSFVV